MMRAATYTLAAVLAIAILVFAVPVLAASGGNGGSVISGPGDANNGGAIAGNGGNGGSGAGTSGNGGNITSTGGSSNNGGASAGSGGAGGTAGGAFNRFNIAELIRIRLQR